MKITRKTLVEILETAFKAGRSCPAEERDGVVRELLAAGQNGKRFRTYTLYELRHLMPGKRLFHPVYGEGEVVMNERHYGIAFGGSQQVFSFVPDNAAVFAYPMSESARKPASVREAKPRH